MINNDLTKTREWAEMIQDAANRGGTISPTLKNVAEIIRSLPDRIIDADKLREVVMRRENTPPSSVQEANFVRELWSLIHPPRPTLAELIEQGNDRNQYVRMQCSVEGVEKRYIIRAFDFDGSVLLLRDNLLISKLTAEKITPRPDLPKLVWPSLSVSGESETVSVETEDVSVETEDVTEESGDAQEAQQEYRPNLGPITLSPPTREEEAEVRKQFEEPVPSDLPRPEDVAARSMWVTISKFGRLVGARSEPNNTLPWLLTDLYEADHYWAADSDVTLVSRLVPEVKP